MIENWKVFSSFKLLLGRYVVLVFLIIELKMNLIHKVKL